MGNYPSRPGLLRCSTKVWHLRLVRKITTSYPAWSNRLVSALRAATNALMLVRPLFVT